MGWESAVGALDLAGVIAATVAILAAGSLLRDDGVAGAADGFAKGRPSSVT
jgi:hypothetical protein